MNRDLLTLNMHRAGQQWATCCAMGDYDEAARIADEIDGYARALERIDSPWNELVDNRHG